MPHAQNLFTSTHVRLAALVLVSALALTACGGGGSSSSTETAGTGTTGTTDTGSTGTGSTDAGTGSTSTGSTSAGTYGNLSGASTGRNASLNGAIPLPANNSLNTSVVSAAVDGNSAAIISNIASVLSAAGRTQVKSDMTIPYVVVSDSQPEVNVNFTQYADESDRVQYPIPANAPVETTEYGSDDRHVLVVDKDNNKLYELFQGSLNSDGSWSASNGAVFDLSSNNWRPTVPSGEHWTSADAAGLPIFPALIRHDEASRGKGAIAHAIRFTLPPSLIRNGFVAPANHLPRTECTAANCLPYGAKLRLKSSFVIPTTYSAEAQAILRALQTHGMILADIGSFFVSGSPSGSWPSNLDTELARATISDFEVVQMGTIN